MKLSVVRGFAAEIRVLPMTLMLLTTLLGGLFSGAVNWKIMGLVLINAFCFLYVAHLNDTFFDLRRGEYGSDRKLHNVRSGEDEYLARWGFGTEVPNAPLLPRKYYLTAMVIVSVIGLAVMLYISTIVGWIYSAVAIVGLFLALTYSAGVDRIPALGDTWWEIGVLFALYAGYCSQTGFIDSRIVVLSLPLFITLIGVKAMDSLPDTLVDHRNNKVTLTVFLYRRGWPLGRIRHVAFLPLYAGFLLLFIMVPPFIRLVVLVVLALIAAVHVGMRNDVECRKSIVAAGFAIIFFLVWTISSVVVVV